MNVRGTEDTGFVAKKKLPDSQIVEADDRGVEIGFQKMLAMIERMPDVTSIEELAEKMPELVQSAVERIQDAAAPYDAFDVVESMKMRELPMGLIGFSEREHDGIAAAIEIAALVLLARGSRAATTAPGDNPGHAVEPIDEAARELLLLGHLSTYQPPPMASPAETARAELARVLKGHELSVRNRQYESVRDQHDPKLFGDMRVASDMKAALGFDYADYLLVRRAIQEIGGARLGAAADRFFGAYESSTASESAESDALDEETREAAQTALNDLFLHPGDRASLLPADLATRTGLDEETVHAVLNPFSLEFGTDDGVAVVSHYLDGVNPFVVNSLLVDSGGRYLSIGAQLGDDALRATVEKSLTGRPKDRYISARARVTEELAASYFIEMIGPDQKYLNLKYWAPSPAQGPEVVDKAATGFRSTATLTEIDALLVAEDVAICIEVKGSSLRQASRAGHGVKLADDLAKTVGDAAQQAARARALIEVNRGLQTEKGWLDLDGIREVHSVVVTLDDLGPAGIALDLMVRAGVVKASRMPWIVSLHDLAVIARVVDLPAELLLYVRRRTEPNFAKVYTAVDELDLFMLYLSGHMYLEDDPDKVAAANPASPPVTSTERKRYARSLVSKIVATHTDPLDQWMYATEHPAETGANQYPKPFFKTEARVRAIVADMSRERKPGWFRASADLLSFSGDTQGRIAHAIEMVATATRADGKRHNAFVNQMSERGHFGLFIGSVPRGHAIAESGATLERYARAKSHQMHADRSLGLLVSPEGKIVGIAYGNHDWQEDPELDALIIEMGLTAVDRMPRSMPPPSSRRETVRLRHATKGKKRKR